MTSLASSQTPDQAIQIDTLNRQNDYTEVSSIHPLSAVKPRSSEDQSEQNERISLNSHCPTRDNSQENLSQEEDNYQLTEGSSTSLDESQTNIEKFSSDDEGDISPCSFQRRNPQFRSNYINRLVTMKVMDLKPKKKSQNIFVFDWDDTLFCTSFLGNLPLTKIPAHLAPYIDALDTTASKILLQAAKENKVFIVTNSDGGWVEKSAALVLPKTYKVMTRKDVKIISARNKFHSAYPNDMYRWKLEAFLELQNEFERDLLTNIVVLGDSDMEIQAGKILSKQYKNVIVKTVKFKEAPKLEDLIKEHKIVLNLFDDIFTGSKNMTIKLGKN